MTDASREHLKMTAGLDLGDNYSHLCLLDAESGEIIEECRLRTIPEAFRRRFDSEQPLKIAMEVGIHSPWVESFARRVWPRGFGSQRQEGEAHL
jgi:hypothetical protein